MFFYRYKVVETHLNKYAKGLLSRYLSGKSEKVFAASPKLQVHKIFDNASKEWVYFAIEAEAISGFICLSKIPRWVALETSMLYVNPDCRGKGIASLLYDAVMRDGVMVISGYSHNLKSRKLWMKMVQNPQYTTWAHDIIDLDSYADLLVEDGNFVCSLKIYEDIKKIRRIRRQDIRIIAFNRRYI